MRKLLLLICVISISQLAGGCGLLFGGKTYNGSEAYSEAHPDQARPMPYMDPDTQYQNDSK